MTFLTQFAHTNHDHGDLQLGPVLGELHDGFVQGELRHDPEEVEVKNAAGIDISGEGVERSDKTTEDGRDETIAVRLITAILTNPARLLHSLTNIINPSNIFHLSFVRVMS